MPVAGRRSAKPVSARDDYARSSKELALDRPHIPLRNRGAAVLSEDDKAGALIPGPRRCGLSQFSAAFSAGTAAGVPFA